MGITERQILEQLEKIRQLRSQGVSDSEIMEQMKLSHGAYLNLKSFVHQNVSPSFS
jgi:DNA-binding transcriptional MerR regulator